MLGTSGRAMELDPKTLRSWARLLSTLLQTPEEELGDFVRERLGGAAVREAALQRGRDLLVHLGRALESPEPERWNGIEMAADTLDHWQRGMTQGAGADVASEPPARAEPIATGPQAGAAAARTPVSDAPGPPLAPTPSPWVPPAAPPRAATTETAAAPQPLAPVAAPSPARPSPVAASPLPPEPATASPSTPPPSATQSPSTPPGSAIASPSTPPPAPAFDEQHHALATTLGMSDAQPPEQALPFQGQAMPPPAVMHMEERHGAQGATAPGGRKGGPTMPFEAVPRQHPNAAILNRPPVLTLKQYAAFCTERSRWPDDVAGRRTRFGLTEDSETHADKYYEVLFASEPARRQEWLTLCQAHQQKLDERG